MSQSDMVIADQPGAAFLSDLNAVIAALVSNSSGATAPATTYAYQFWADTGSTPPMLRLRNAANNAWIPIGSLADLGIQTGAQSLATVGGTADALTLTFSPALTALHGGIFQFVAASDNATTTPTGNPDGLGAKTFIKGNNLALVAGDIKSGMTMLARYDSVLGKLALLNPATGVTAGSIADGSITPAKLSQPFTAGTAVATTSGTAIDFTSIPSWVKRITVMFNGVSTNFAGSSHPIIQIGDSGGIETTGYLGAAGFFVNGGASSVINPTIGFGVAVLTGTPNTLHGVVVLTLLDSATNLWAMAGVLARGDGASINNGGGTKSLSGVLDRIRLTMVNGTDAFDAGSVNIHYE